VAKPGAGHGLADCQRSLQVRPGDADTLDSLAFVHFRQGNFADAVTGYDAALAKTEAGPVDVHARRRQAARRDAEAGQRHRRGRGAGSAAWPRNRQLRGHAVGPTQSWRPTRRRITVQRSNAPVDARDLSAQEISVVLQSHRLTILATKETSRTVKEAIGVGIDAVRLNILDSLRIFAREGQRVAEGGQIGHILR